MTITETVEFWVLIYILEFAVLGRILSDNFLRERVTSTTLVRAYNLIGFNATMIGTAIYLISYAGLFMFDTQTDLCMVAELSQDIVNQTKALDCVTKGNDLRLDLFLWGGIAITIILMGNIFLAIQNFRNNNTSN
ncbi:hypothetical protein [Nitrosopumilus sp.]|uniref:hypothetical protein n=1 Tax=Nitrosopumilus sp. TaxID=2024843 RepID=UPI003D0E2DFA